MMPTVAEATSDYARGIVGMDRARVLLRAGLFREADATLLEASEALTHTDLVQVLAEVELARAEAALLAENHRLAREPAAGRPTGSGPAATTGSPAWPGWSSCRPRPPTGCRRPAPATADRLAAELARHRLTDHARTAGLMALEACWTPDQAAAASLPRPGAADGAPGCISGWCRPARVRHRPARAGLGRSGEG